MNQSNLKRFLIGSLFLLYHTVGFCQPIKKHWLLGGYGSFSSSTANNSGSTLTTLSTTLAPNAGYFFLDRLSVGSRVGWRSVSDQINGGASSKSFSFTAFLRQYLLKASDKVNLFLEGGYIYKSTAEGGGPTQKERGFLINAGPAFFFEPTVALEVSIGYSHTKLRDENFRYNQFITSVGFQFFPGNARR